MELTFKVAQTTNDVVLNSKNIEILSASCKLGPPESITYDEDLELVTLHFEAPIKEGRFVLSLEFKGHLNDNMEGFYRSTAKTEAGKEQIILSTDFEPTYARQAFPCLDEPDRKAKFEISLVVLDHLVALSNMPEVSREVVDTPASLPAPTNSRNYVKITFDQSPVMSTYLVAMVIGHFDHSSVEDSNGVKIRVFTPVGKAHYGYHALRMAKSALPFYADLFGTKFPLPKLDLIAIPDFSMGAMENWGLITYRETALLIDSAKSSLQSKRNVARTVSHELAHMWFGNLVTMEWWTHLWLNEGFATFIEYLAVDHCFPEYDIWTIFLTDEFYSAMELDELKTSHPIEVPVNSPSEIEEIFDAVSYEKGASIIRMLRDYIGPEHFKRGLQLYISRHMYSNTVTEDLWQALSEVCNQPIADIMSSWTKRTGFPVLSVRPATNCSGSRYHLAIEQLRFLADGTHGDSGSEWYVPVSICDVADSSKVLVRTVVPPRSVSKDLPTMVAVPCPDGVPPKVRLNPNAVGFYRVNYSDELLPPILDALGQHKLSACDRLCILSDQFALARAGHCSLTSALTLASSFVGETDYAIWCELRSQLNYIRALLQEASYTSCDKLYFPPPTPAEEGLSDLVLHLAAPTFNKLSWDQHAKSESNNDTLLRPLLIAMLGAAGSEKVVQEAFAMFARHYKAIVEDATGDDHKPEDIIPADLRVAIYSTVLRHGGEEEFNRLLCLHEKAEAQDERVRILHCLGVTRKPELVERTIALALSDFVRKQDRLRPLMSLSSSPAGRRAVLKLIKTHIANLDDTLGRPNLTAHVVRAACEGFCTPHYHAEIEQFFTENPISSKRAVQQALESISVNVSLLQRESDRLTPFLLQFKNLG
ncbi:hypothetical protein AAHC03_024269 [Spirometra sp. Aus1]